MEAFAITSRGIEDIAAKEIEELVSCKAKAANGCVSFGVKDMKEIAKVCHMAQSVDRVALLLSSFGFKEDGLDDCLKKEIFKIEFGKRLSRDKTFKVVTVKQDSDVSSDEICAKAGEFVIEHIKKDKGYRQKADMENPDIIILVYVAGGKCYLGIDFSGFDMHKRSYRVFMDQKAVRATIAYAMVRISGLKPGDTILDCFSGAGSVVIEAAYLDLKRSVRFYEKDKYAFLKFIEYDFGLSEVASSSKIIGYDPQLMCVVNAKKNAKIAGVEKFVKISRVDVEWMDTKFDKGSVDRIVTRLPELSRYGNKRDIEKLYNEFFYQADFVLSDSGKIVVIMHNEKVLLSAASKYKFKVESKREVYSGKEKLCIVVFGK